jgi:hypothetical protein
MICGRRQPRIEISPPLSLVLHPTKPLALDFLLKRRVEESDGCAKE